MSGFTRDTKHYGDALVYEVLLSKWYRYHERHCGCDRDLVDDHIIPAGFTVIREGSGFLTITGPGLTSDVDENQLTTNKLWEAVTGKPGDQSWFESVRNISRG